MLTKVILRLSRAGHSISETYQTLAINISRFTLTYLQIKMTLTWTAMPLLLILAFCNPALLFTNCK